ncbi:hypothetical protein [Spirosoma sordidisoli]|uniref:Uncharacterized protein n=1 Tax=Spirosoma sordidisoli TaxID=2502893 RepID=A0A4Q2UJI1_9BACT|nr:hypothetical protein [Spirosoma sordidisoli]RYC69647.1 hypothetical protein EQG79_13685 [Spirosoma sordidisoli]
MACWRLIKLVTFFAAETLPAMNLSLPYRIILSAATLLILFPITHAIAYNLSPTTAYNFLYTWHVWVTGTALATGLLLLIWRGYR